VLLRLRPDTSVGVGGRQLSGGEQRRPHLARAIATLPDVLLIDEPNNGLDAATAAQVLEATRDRLADAVLVLTMHEPSRDLLTPGVSIVFLE
jgi:ATP-binding cassette, subfamily C, bacterial CydC